MLIVFGGLPGAGKTTLSRAIASDIKATWLRVDAIEAAVWRAGVSRSEPTGIAAYVIANALADAQLTLGGTVVVDAVNPVEEARAGWRELARLHRVPLRVIEVVCSNPDEHRRRVEARLSDLAGFAVPTWEQVLQQEYQPWSEPRLKVDTLDDGAGKQVSDYCVKGHPKWTLDRGYDPGQRHSSEGQPHDTE